MYTIYELKIKETFYAFRETAIDKTSTSEKIQLFSTPETAYDYMFKDINDTVSDAVKSLYTSVKARCDFSGGYINAILEDVQQIITIYTITKRNVID